MKKLLSFLLAATMVVSTMVVAGADEIVEITDTTVEEGSEIVEENLGASEEWLQSGIIDTEAPVLKDVYFVSKEDKKREATIKAGEDTLKVYVDASDNLSGVNYASIYFTAKVKETKDGQEREVNKSLSVQVNMNRTTGELLSEFKASGTTTPAEYTIDHVYLYDNAGNSVTYYANDSYSGKGNKILSDETKTDKITVTKGEPLDNDLKSLSLDKTEVTGPATIKATGAMKELQKDYSYVHLYFGIFKNERKYPSSTLSATIYDNQRKNEYTGNISIGKYTTPGTYQLYRYSFYDENGNEHEVNTTNGDVLPEALKDIKFVVKENPDAKDTDRPSLAESGAIKFSTNKINVPGTLMAEVKATDPTSNAKSASIYLRRIKEDGSFDNSGNNSYIYISVSAVKETKTDENGDTIDVYYDTDKSIMKGGNTISQYVANGKYAIDYIYLYDEANNRREYHKTLQEYMKKDENKDQYLELPKELADIIVEVVNDDQDTDGAAKKVTTSTTLETLVEDIKNAPEGNEIHVDITGKYTVSKDAFNAIKGTKKTLLLNSNSIQWVVKGEDITKDVTEDIYMSGYDSNGSDTILDKLLDTNKYFYFFTNGKENKGITLPFDSTLRIITKNYTYKKIETKENLYVYNYTQTIEKKDEKNVLVKAELTPIASKLNMTDELNLEVPVKAGSTIRELVVSEKEAKTLVYDPNSKSKYVDIDTTKWYANAVNWAIGQGLMNGTSDTEFCPTGDCTRTMMVTIVYRYAPDKTGAADSVPFTDVKAGSWYDAAVKWAYGNKVTKGLNDTTFGVGDGYPVKRDQVAQFLYNYAVKCGKDVTADADLSKYTDVSSVPKWATTAMNWANKNGIVNGKQNKTDGTYYLDAEGKATRAEIAQMVMNYFNKYGK